MATGETREAVAQPPRESRALVALAPASATASSARYGQATFLAQLIATKDRHPQTRERRRAEPAEAAATYRAIASLAR